jgi:hypothetical protein
VAFQYLCYLARLLSGLRQYITSEVRRSLQYFDPSKTEVRIAGVPFDTWTRYLNRHNGFGALTIFGLLNRLALKNVTAEVRLGGILFGNTSRYSS